MRWLVAVSMLSVALPAVAETLTLEQAIDRALRTDPRIEERRHLVEAARALKAEADGHGGWMLDANAFLALATAVDGSIFKNGGCTVGTCELRDDRYDIDGLTPWMSLQLTLVKPLYTFGKLENYREAATANVSVKEQDVRLQRAATVLDVKRAYYGYLAARDGRLLLEDTEKRIRDAIDLVQRWLDEDTGEAVQSDLYALQSGLGLVGKYRAQAQALENVALDGLKVLTGVGLGQPLEVPDKHIEALPLPVLDLPVLQGQALERRPEMSQVEAGLRARRALVQAKKAEATPNVYAGLAGLLSYAPGRDRLDNPYISDPFNDVGLTPLVGIKWDWAGEVQSARTAGAEAELNALIAKSTLARQGIPYQVAEAYHQVQAYHESVQRLSDGAQAARRWMVSSYADFEAGLERADKVVQAFQGYVVTYADYLQTIFDYNMHVAKLEDVTGAVP